MLQYHQISKQKTRHSEIVAKPANGVR